MAKKNFNMMNDPTEGKTILDNETLTGHALDSLLTTSPQEEKRSVGRPKKSDIIRDNAAQNGLTEEYTRATFILSVRNLERLRDYAYTERYKMKEAIDKVIDSFMNEYEKEHELIKRNK